MDASFHEVAPLRQAARETVRELGMLDHCLGDLGLTQAQCHVLIELERNGVLGVQDLADVLRVDKSTMSRAVASLERSGFVTARDEPDDRRRKPLTLTARGKKKLDRIHEFSNRLVSDALALLTEDERRTVLSGMSLYAKALQRARAQKEYEIRPIEPKDDPDVAGIIRRVMPEFGADGPGFAIHDPEVNAMSEAYAGDRSAYFVVTRRGSVVGGGGFAPLQNGPEDVCELRKMYFLPDARGHGVGKKLLLFVLDRARAAGFSTCYLETLDRMARARELYRSVGFTDLDAPMGCTGHFGCNSWMARDLGPSRPQ
jgi:putative acetyltransferase